VNTQTLITFFKKHPIGVGCALLAVVLGVLTFLRSGHLTEVKALLEERSTLGGRLKNNLRYSADLDAHLAVVTEAIAEVETKVINPGALATNQQFFYRLEEELGITIVDLRQEVVRKSTQPKEFITVPYILSVQGTYVQLIELLQRLEEGDRLIRFVDANFSLARGAEAQGADPYNPLILLTLDLELLGRS
jgi:hypothetical protein